MDNLPVKPRSWPQKFRDAFRGIAIGMRGQSSFVVHTFCALAVICVATWVGMSAWRWCTLLLCVFLVFVTEMLNTSLEILAKVVSPDYHPQVRDALDIASGAVLVAATGAVIIGGVVLASALW